MNNISLFFKDAWSELKQVNWLTVPQMVASTWVVVILSLLMAMYVGAIDFILSRIFGILI